MQNVAGRLTLSPSDLNHFLECEYLIHLERTREGTQRRPRDAHADLLAAKGLEHETSWLRRFRDEGRSLRDMVPTNVQVGTVDKFQGREAPVVFFSMASSTGEDVPRGLEFLFNRNRFNVAVSRAKCLSVVVCSPRLLEARCRTVEQMRLVNALCLFVEESRQEPIHG
jgi:hypothetical protein